MVKMRWQISARKTIWPQLALLNDRLVLSVNQIKMFKYRISFHTIIFYETSHKSFVRCGSIAYTDFLIKYLTLLPILENIENQNNLLC